MSTNEPDNSLGTGVYFAPEDYVGFLSRIVIWVLDIIAIIFLLMGFIVLGENFSSYSELLIWTYCFIVWFYLTDIKASKIGTLGFWLTGSKIITLKGERPSFIRMTFRLLLWCFGPINLIYDLFWSGIDDDKQTLRDRFAGTMVIKKKSEPLDTAPIHLMYFNAFGLTLMYPRVMRPRANPNAKENDIEQDI